MHRNATRTCCEDSPSLPLTTQAKLACDSSILYSSGLSQVEDTGIQVFHAGTALKDKQVVSSGGRVLTVTAVRPSLEAALQAANQGVAAVGFPGAVYRRDIGHKAIAHFKQRRCV